MSELFDGKRFLANITSLPGVYQMLGNDGEILYVGKAKNLKKRLSSYFQKNLSLKTSALMRLTVDIKVLITHTETEALILENNLIKAHKPRFNILFRDDKSYPYIYAETKKTFPRFRFYRGGRHLPGKYFGPYPNVTAVREILNLIQKVFLIRSCEDAFFSHRTRPCLQYQIKRCSAPCVGYINEEQYQLDFNAAISFLSGKDETILNGLEKKMKEAALHLDYELASKYRDQISQLRQIQANQYAVKGKRNIDIIVSLESHGVVCIGLFMIRQGQILGNKTYVQEKDSAAEVKDIIESFVNQHYLASDTNLPDLIITTLEMKNKAALLDAVKQLFNHSLSWQSTLRDETKKWHDMAIETTKQALLSKLNTSSHLAEKFLSLNKALLLESDIERIECFDISHTGGESTVASCVVFDLSGPKKKEYRRFNITNIVPGDDYAAMRQAILRRYQRLKKEEALLPDLLLIDGGKGQLTQAKSVLEELQINDVYLLGIAKGVSRKPGLETLFLSGKNKPIYLDPDSPALHLLQQIRDEAHRFAITHQRKKTQKTRFVSVLQQIEGIGPKKRQALLTYFGGLNQISSASIDQLMKVDGVNRALAEKIYDACKKNQ